MQTEARKGLIQAMPVLDDWLTGLTVREYLVNCHHRVKEVTKMFSQTEIFLVSVQMPLVA